LKTSYRSALNSGMILVSGANGFLGRALVNRGASDGLRLRAAVRRPGENWPSGVESALTEDLAAEGDWRTALDGVDAVVNCAARVHVMRDTSADPLAEFRRVNVAGTLNLARQAADAGVRRFIYISSIGVNGAETFDMPFAAEDKAAPHSPYAVSKHEAELGLRRLAQETGLEVVIIRPPLVFGPGARGNFNTLLLIVYRGIPLPLGAIHNKRSLVALDNLVDLIVICLHHPAAANQTFLVSDGEDLSTTVLLRRTGAALGKPARLIPVPVLVLRTAARLLGKVGLAQQLCGSLQVDISKTRDLLDWTPPVSVDHALMQTARHFLANRHN
jgi:UDP-N-acetyl-alpha-D-quinovosamine dehydrogenase